MVVFRPGDCIVPSRVRDISLGNVAITTGENAGTSERGFDTTPESFGDINPDTFHHLTITKNTVSETGLVVLEFAGGAKFPNHVNFGGMRISVIQDGESQFYGKAAMKWNAANSRYESTHLHPQLFEALQ